MDSSINKKNVEKPLNFMHLTWYQYVHRKSACHHLVPYSPWASIFSPIWHVIRHVVTRDPWEKNSLYLRVRLDAFGGTITVYGCRSVIWLCAFSLKWKNISEDITCKAQLLIYWTQKLYNIWFLCISQGRLYYLFRPVHEQLICFLYKLLFNLIYSP